jgi:hypothetical protein
MKIYKVNLVDSSARKYKLLGLSPLEPGLIKNMAARKTSQFFHKSPNDGILQDLSLKEFLGNDTVFESIERRERRHIRREFPDFSCPDCNEKILIVSERFRQITEHLMPKWTEWISIGTIKDKPFYILHFVHKIQALDLSNSAIRWHDEVRQYGTYADFENQYMSWNEIRELQAKRTVFTHAGIYRPSFDEAEIAKSPLFELQLGHRGIWFCNEELKNIMETNDLRIESDFSLYWDSEDPDVNLREWHKFTSERIKLFKQRHPTPNELDQFLDPPEASLELVTPDLRNPQLEQPLSETILNQQTQMIRDALGYLNTIKQNNLDETSRPDEIIAGIAATLESLRSQRLSNTMLEPIARNLGVLFGQQLVRAYDWRWANIRDAISVVSADSSFVIEPVPFLWQVLEKRKAVSHVIITFSLFTMKRFEAVPGSYTPII